MCVVVGDVGMLESLELLETLEIVVGVGVGDREVVSLLLLMFLLLLAPSTVHGVMWWDRMRWPRSRRKGLGEQCRAPVLV